jgi:hypothetical protein
MKANQPYHYEQQRHCNPVAVDPYSIKGGGGGGSRAMKRYVALYGDRVCVCPIDLLFLGLVARGFFTSEVGDMLGEIRPTPAILFTCCTWPAS